MPNINGLIIRELLEKKPEDLLSMMDRVGDHRNDLVSNVPKSRNELMIFSMARRHVWFKTKFGHSVSHARIEDKFYEEFPQYFNEWINLGCPVLDVDILNSYLEKNPINL